MSQIVSLARLKRVIREFVQENHKTTLMSLDDKKLLKTNTPASLSQMTKNILEASPLQVFATMSIQGFFVTNRYIVKDNEFNSIEQDALLTLMEYIRFEFGEDMINSLINKESILSNMEIQKKIHKDKKLIVAYLLALSKDMIMIEAEKTAKDFLSSDTSVIQN